MGRNGSPGEDIETGVYKLPLNHPDTTDVTYADQLQPANDDIYQMGSVDARADLLSQWPAYVGTQHFKAEFTDIGDTEYCSEFAGMGYRNDINQDIGGETGASNAIPYWSAGPVTGRASRMTGEFLQLHRPMSDGGYGDVNGAGSDYGRQLAAAYYQDAVAAYATEYANASVMAAI